MIFSTLVLNKDEAIYVQLERHILEGIKKGELKKGSKLPSTREASKFLNVSRNSVIAAYEELEGRDVIVTKRGKGTFVSVDGQKRSYDYYVDWENRTNYYSSTLRDLDIIKSELPYEKGMISFKSIAPEEDLFNIEDFKRALLDAWTFEQENLLNYGYAKGYKPLIEYFLDYMEGKGVSTNKKDILITNGFTEAFDIILASLTKPGDVILCEEPTHNTALKIMKSYGLKVVQIPMDKDGIDLKELEEAFKKYSPSFGYLIPSYNNPTGIVTKGERRKELMKLFREYKVPIIEDGFNEELLYSSSPQEPLAALGGEGNGVIYIGSLSKILFPGLRIGWVLSDSNLIDTLESVKRGRTIHSSFLDQSAFYYYLKSGAFGRYLKNVRKFYKDKYNLVMENIEKYIDSEYVTGEGGLHIFIKLKNSLNARKLLEKCYKRGVIFMPGDIFFENTKGEDSLRIGFGRVSDENIVKGIKIIGEEIRKLS
ncbi:PLP-dependent aminotransferase family protein [Clostridium sp. SHJSY1]|uniref:MocR-like pyridoxine biosynthesis transcription factor PdxR n=1 Tax=Clostridium sp. SHJSY1 TaxID=2942483 RepID=UPI002877073E|nr:PLP-dependent aminotransferase family protein [Clostridium sp. SHJSY1]MDS0524655.1 PLP-dependent aminotransferase family protein [Clostridium sp. SHJSY1]